MAFSGTPLICLNTDSKLAPSDVGLFLITVCTYTKFNANNKLCSRLLTKKGFNVQEWINWLVIFGFNATLTARIISWQSMTHICFLVFSHQYNSPFFRKSPITFLTCFSRGERQKYTGKKVCLNCISNSQPPGQTRTPLNHLGEAKNGEEWQGMGKRIS